MTYYSFNRSESSALEQEAEAVWAVVGGSRGDNGGHAPHHPVRPGGLLGSSDDPGTPLLWLKIGFHYRMERVVDLEL